MTDNTPAEAWQPYVYRTVLPMPSGTPPRRVHDYQGNGLNTVKEGEQCDSWIIFYPSQVSDDDVYIVYWDRKRGQWFWQVAGYHSFDIEHPIGKLEENTAMVLLEYFGLMGRSEDYSPQRLLTMPPEELQRKPSPSGA